MTAEQYRAALERLGFSQIRGGKWLGIAGRTSQNYANGATPIPEPTARLIRLVLKLKLTPDQASKLWR